jgi:hypothetical protein
MSIISWSLFLYTITYTNTSQASIELYIDSSDGNTIFIQPASPAYSENMEKQTFQRPGLQHHISMCLSIPCLSDHWQSWIEILFIRHVFGDATANEWI